MKLTDQEQKLLLRALDKASVLSLKNVTRTELLL
jgi:hypothetical protein